MKQFNDPEFGDEGDEILIPPKCGWQSMDGQYNFTNQSDKHVSIWIFYEDDGSVKTPEISEN